MIAWFSRMAVEWTNKKMAVHGLSRGSKASLMGHYGKYSQPWSRARLAEVAKGLKDVVDLTPGTSRGYDRPPRHVIEAVQKAIEGPAYDSATGTKVASDLRQAIAEGYEKRYGIDTDPQTEVLLTVGASQAIDCTLRVLLDPGDEVLLMDPDYAPYEAHILSFQAKPIPVPLKEDKPGQWSFDLNALRRRVTEKTKLLMMSNANNPTGFLYTKEENEAIAELAIKNDFFVLADHVSEQVVFDGATLNNIAVVPGMKERTIVCSSFSKAHNLPGFRTGYAIGNSDILQRMANVIGWMTDGIVTPGVVAALAVLTGPQDWVREHIKSLQERRDLMVNWLNKMKGVACGSPKGVYWAFPNIKGTGMPSHDLSEYLLTEGKVNVRPGIWYGKNGEGHLRIAFCVNPEWIQKGMERMEAALSKLG